MTEFRFSWWGNYSPRSGAHVRFICISRSSPASCDLIPHLHLIRREVGLFFSAAWRSGRVFDLGFTHEKYFDCLHPPNQVPSSALFFLTWDTDLFYAGVCWGATSNVRSNGVSVCFSVCVCVTERQRGQTQGRGIIRLHLITHRWLILGLRVWRCSPIHHFLCANTNTCSYTNTTPLCAVAISRPKAQVTVPLHNLELQTFVGLDEIDVRGNIPQFVQRWGVIDGGFIVGGDIPATGTLVDLLFQQPVVWNMNNVVVKENM